MPTLLIFVYLSCAVFALGDDASSWRSCQNFNKKEDVNLFEVNPGHGWDNLVNEPRGNVFSITYKQCLSTNNGLLFPDYVTLVPKRVSKFRIGAEIFDNWLSYTSLTSDKINADVGDGYNSIHGSLSAEKINIREKQNQYHSVISRVQLRVHYYTAFVQPDIPFTSYFRDRLLDLAAQISSGNNGTAKYLSDLLVLDFGTHVISSIDAGGILAKVNQVKQAFIDSNRNNQASIKAAATADFFKYINLGVNLEHRADSAMTDEYTKSLSDESIILLGGPPYRANFSVNNWIDQLHNQLVAINRQGLLLYEVINNWRLTGLSPHLVNQVIEHVRKALLRYYSANAIKGCTYFTSRNFDFQANVEDIGCESQSSNFSFGGVFQKCFGDHDLCATLIQKNPFTGNFSCPKWYQTVLLNDMKDALCVDRCKGWGLMKRCQKYCSSVETYWCSMLTETSNSDNGYLFGGLYSTSFVNIVTGSNSCPPTFYAVKFGLSVKICVSTDYEYGKQYQLPFGGFFNCRIGNSLALHEAHMNTKMSHDSSSWPYHCPQGFSQHLLTIEKDCASHYCIRKRYLDHVNNKEVILIRKPPFELLSDDAVPKMISASPDSIWVRNDKNQWIRQTQTNSMLNTFVEKKADAASIALLIGLILNGLLAFGILLLIVCYRRQMRRLLTLSQKYEKLHNFQLRHSVERNSRMQNYGSTQMTSNESEPVLRGVSYP